MRFGFLISLLCHLTALEGGVFLFETKLENLPKSTILDINSFKPSVGKEIDPFLKGNF